MRNIARTALTAVAAVALTAGVSTAAHAVPNTDDYGPATYVGATSLGISGYTPWAVSLNTPCWVYGGIGTVNYGTCRGQIRLNHTVAVGWKTDVFGRRYVTKVYVYN